MNKSVKNTIKYIIFLLLGILLVWLVFRNQNKEEMLNGIKNTNWFWILFSMFFGVLSVWLRAKRWLQMLKPMGYEPSVSNAFYSVAIGYFVNYGVPRAGELSRCATLLKTDDVPAEKSLGTVVAERIIDLIILMALVLIAFILQFDQLTQLFKDLQNNGSNNTQSSSLSIYIYISLGLLVLTIMMFIVFRKRLTQLHLVQKIIAMFKGFVSGLSSISKVENKWSFALYSISIWGCYLLMMYTSFLSYPATSHLGFAEAITTQAVGTFGIVVPVPGGGAGAFHYFISQGLTIFGVPETEGKIFATIVHASQMLMFVVVGIFSFIMINRSTKKTV